MTARFADDLREVLVPARGSRHGPLAPLLLSLTFVTGLVDAFSYLLLGHVFVSNMTGNVVFIGFAFAGAAGFSILASLVALASFSAGALLGGRIGHAHRGHRGQLFTRTVSLEALLFAAGVVVAAVGGEPVSSGYRYSLIVLLGIAMGMQNATARRLAVPDLQTTVITLTITGMLADSAVAGGTGSVAGRRLVPVTAMLLGALAGALLALDVHVVAPLAIAFVVTAVAAVISSRVGATDEPWVQWN
jgi:uncharacterized membrane protein YoaK (UPF0700 family)